MSYSIVHTDAFVLRTIPDGESNIAVVLLSRDLGKIYAHAQNARSLSSKMRYAIQQYGRGVFSAVRGRYGWRLVGAEYQPSFIMNSGQYQGVIPAIARVFHLVHRLLPAEGQDDDIYEHVDTLYRALHAEPYSLEESGLCEIITVSHILNTLGYWNNEPMNTGLPASLSREALEKLKPQKNDYIRAINNAIAVAQQ